MLELAASKVAGRTAFDHRPSRRESKLAAGESERSLYYNLEPELPLDDLTAVEATRWNVLPLGLAGALGGGQP